jgi:hypothetical protein
VIKFGRVDVTAIREKVKELGSSDMHAQRKCVQRCHRLSRIDPLTLGLQKRKCNF